MTATDKQPSDESKMEPENRAPEGIRSYFTSINSSLFRRSFMDRHSQSCLYC